MGRLRRATRVLLAFSHAESFLSLLQQFGLGGTAAGVAMLSAISVGISAAWEFSPWFSVSLLVFVISLSTMLGRIAYRRVRRPAQEPQRVELSGTLTAGVPSVSGTLTVINPPRHKRWSVRARGLIQRLRG